MKNENRKMKKKTYTIKLISFLNFTNICNNVHIFIYTNNHFNIFCV